MNALGTFFDAHAFREIASVESYKGAARSIVERAVRACSLIVPRFDNGRRGRKVERRYVDALNRFARVVAKPKVGSAERKFTCAEGPLVRLVFP